jgi:hypothetical protein
MQPALSSWLCKSKNNFSLDNAFRIAPGSAGWQDGMMCRTFQFCSLMLLGGLSLSTLHAQPPIESLAEGFRRFEQGRLTLVTDVPIDDDLREWSEVLEQAIATWTEHWRLSPSQTENWKLTAVLIGDRKRFEASGLAEKVPAFEDGYQLQNTVYLVEQPSIYYRRHLFLHEATHWAMYRAFGGAGSPWFMEGMAELYGTHRWNQNRLTLAIVPKAPADVPQWGRFKRLREMISRQEMPSLKQILNYTTDSADRMDRYVWSWVACYFFANHPTYKEAFATASRPPLDYSMTLSQKLSKSLEGEWPRVVDEWNGFLADFDFGFQPERSMPVIAQYVWQDWDPRSKPELNIQADRGWQGTGIRVRRGESLRLVSHGSYIMGRGANGADWPSEPQGITIRYIDHQPLGRLLATIVPLTEEVATLPWQPISVGTEAVLQPESDGLLFLKINDLAGELDNNTGVAQVIITASGLE